MTSQAESKQSVKVHRHELDIARVFDAPRELVWKVWTEPEHVKLWWGPRGWTAPYVTIDLREGGQSLYAMRSAEGQTVRSKGIFIEIKPMQKIVTTDSFADEKGNIVPSTRYGLKDYPLEMQVTIQFEDYHGKTRLTLKHRGFPNKMEADGARNGWSESFDKMAEYLKGLTGQSSVKGNAISRVFDAPRDRIWKIWTDSDEVKKWWGPAIFTAPEIRIDLAVGGKFAFDMRGPGFDGTVRDYWNTGKFLEIVPMQKIVQSLSFADDKGNPVSASYYKMPGDWPMETKLTVTFEDVEGGKTRVTVVEEGIPADTVAPSRMGWEQQMDKIAAILRQAPKTTFNVNRDDKQVIIERIFDAPREAVWKVFTDPQAIPQLWGPARLQTTVDKMDLRPGGEWRFIQRDASGKEYGFHGKYMEIVTPMILVDTFNFEGIPPGHEVVETAILENFEGKTRMTSTARYATIEDLDGMVSSGMEKGSVESWERLDALVEKK